MPKKQKLRLLVTPAGYDDMGQVLSGLGYSFAEAPLDPEDLCIDLRQCDALFVNCASCDLESIAEHVAFFVRNGGTVFASDWACVALDSLDTRGLSFSQDYTDAQELQADLVDPEFRKVMNRSTIKLTFDLGSWAYATSIPSGARTLLEGPVDSAGRWATSKQTVPLAFMFGYGKGTVCFTSFHNHAQTSEMERTLLSLLALTPIAKASGHSITKLAEEHGLITR